MSQMQGKHCLQVAVITKTLLAMHEKGNGIPYER